MKWHEQEIEKKNHFKQFNKIDWMRLVGLSKVGWIG